MGHFKLFKNHFMKNKSLQILVTGGAGYIGSHTVLELLENNFDVIVLDNLCNSSAESIKRVDKISGKKTKFVHGSIEDINILEEIFKNNDIFAVIHFAALKAVSESVAHPLKYYKNNVAGTLTLLRMMSKYSINNFIFSSSATVYGEESEIPYNENMKIGTPTSPYGHSKVMIERFLKDLTISNQEFKAVSLRYFNPIGAHQSGEIGEDPHGVPNNLMPYIAQVAIGKRDSLKIFGNDYLTKDGTCRRDYIHVVDLARGHLNALNWILSKKDFNGLEIFNLGTGKPSSVLEVVQAFFTATGIQLPYKFEPRRPGDLPEFWADPSKANNRLNWSSKFTLLDMMNDTWRWQSKNPNGFDK